MLHCADNVTLVLQDLQHLLQHRLTQVRAEVQASTGQDVQEVAALIHICKKRAVVSAWTHLSEPPLFPLSLPSIWKPFPLSPESEPAS